MMNIEDVISPTIGKFYDVPCVLLRSTGRFWPIIGTWHEDADIGVPNFHFHYDARFLSMDQFASGGNSPRILGKVHINGVPGEASCVPLVVRKRRKALREMPEFPMAAFVTKLEKDYADQKMKCMKCPHRGMDLKWLPTKDGTVVCNGHGLKWDLATGKLIPRS